ncbi:MAG: hypothetical protein ACI8RZ_007704 [Myxococcota bacterium]|jgi:hypothetical protein
MPPLNVILFSLIGCDTLNESAAGQWSGSCSLEAQSSYDEPIEVWFDLDVLEEDEGRILGDGVFTYGHDDYAGKVRGHRDESELELELEGSSEGHSTRLEIEGDLVGNRVNGWCSFYGVSGSLVMSR